MTHAVDETAPGIEAITNQPKGLLVTSLSLSINYKALMIFP